MNHTKWSDWLKKRNACDPAQKWVDDNKYDLKQSWERCRPSRWLAWLLSETETTDLRATVKKAVRVSYEIANEILRETKNPPKAVVDGMYAVYRLLSGDLVAIQHLRTLRDDLLRVDGELVNWLHGIFMWACSVVGSYPSNWEYMTYDSLCDLGDLVREARGISVGASSGYHADHADHDVVDLELCEIIRANFRCPTTGSLRRSRRTT